MKVAEKEAISLLITGAWVLTQNKEREVFSPGAVALKGEEIVAVGPPEDLHKLYAPGQVLDYPQGLIIPGLINSHTHAAMSLFRGLADDLPLEDWLNLHIFPAEKHLNGDYVYWGTKLAVAEMLLSGTTTFCDMYLWAGQVAQAAAETGIRAVVGEVLYDFPSPNYGPPAAGLLYSEELWHTWRDQWGHVSCLLTGSVMSRTPLQKAQLTIFTSRFEKGCHGHQTFRLHNPSS